MPKRKKPKSCVDKIRYESEDAANQVVKAREEVVGFLRAYPCRHCKGWHITHLPDKQKMKPITF